MSITEADRKEGYLGSDHTDGRTQVTAAEEDSPVCSTALRKAFGGGLPGALAMVLQVLLLMWLRTTVNYQMVTGVPFALALRTLWNQGGISRFYQGLWVALIQAPLSRFGDTAANTGVLAALERRALPVFVKTGVASAAAALWRIAIVPVDTLKSLLQVHGGADGIAVLSARLRSRGIGTLYSGAAAATLATFMGHYPWFLTNNQLEARVPSFGASVRARHIRRAAIGFCCSFISDCVTNSIRVVKVYSQTSPEPVGYVNAVLQIVAKDGIGGLLWRGLAAKILCNGLGSILFSIVWKALMEHPLFRIQDEKPAEENV
jgi:hypothetical protein